MPFDLKVFKKNKHLPSIRSPRKMQRPAGKPPLENNLRARCPVFLFNLGLNYRSMHQRISQRAECLTEDLAYLSRLPVAGRGFRERSRRGGIVPSENGALHKNRPLGNGQLLQPIAQGTATRSMKHSLQLTGGNPGSRQVILFNAASARRGNGRSVKRLGISLAQSG